MEIDAIPTDKYVRIHPRFKLRGWMGQPYAVVDSLRATAHFVTEGIFGTLKLCNGAFRVSDAVFLGPRQLQLKQLAHDGALEFLDEPSALEPDQEYRYYPNRYMRQVQWSMTGRCNYRCRHCFMSAPRGVLPQPSTEECLRIADQIAECGVQVVRLTGGECLIRQDFLQIIDRLLQGGVQIATILSNGALITGELLDAFEERGVLCGFDISFDGADGWHDWLRGVPGAEEAAIRAFKLCHERGFPTGAQVILHKGNVSVLRKSIRLLGELGVTGVLVGIVKPEGEALGMSDQFLSHEEFFDVCCEYLPQFLEDGAPVASITLGSYFKVIRGVPELAKGGVDRGRGCVNNPACGTIQSTLYLGSDGFILPCIPASENEVLKERFPNIENMTLTEALTDSSYLDLLDITVGDVFQNNPKCQACTYRTRCGGGCRIRGVDKDGNIDTLGHDPETCAYFLGGRFDCARTFLEQLSVKA